MHDSIQRTDRDAKGISRSGLFKRLALGVAGVSAAGVTAAELASAKTASGLSARDRDVLTFALRLEHLQTSFYTAALRGGKLTGEAHQFAEIVGREEEAHLRYLESALHTHGVSAGKYRFGDALTSNKKFVTAAVKLEETGLAAYNGQAGNVSRGLLGSIARVISVEARHAAWARGLAGIRPAPMAVDKPISAAAAISAIRPYIA